MRLFKIFRSKSLYMPLLVLLLLLVGVGNVNAQLADSPWPMFHRDIQHTGSSPYDTSHIDGTVKWTFETGDGIESSPVIDSSGTVYFGSHDGYLYALNPNGTLKWKFEIAKPVYDERWRGYKSIMATPAIDSNGTIYINGASNYLHAINPDGTEKWSFYIKWHNDFWNSPTIAPDGTIYIGTARNDNSETSTEYPAGVYAINPNGTEKWRYPINTGVTSIPAIGRDGTLYIGAAEPVKNNGKVFALTPEGKYKWEFTMEQWEESSATVSYDGTIYIGSKEGNLYAITPEGKEKWRFETGSGISIVPAITKDSTVLFGSWNGNFYALDKNGTEKWRFKTPEGFEALSSSPAVGSDGTIYFGSTQNGFYALNSNGSEKWHITNPHDVISSPAIGKDGTIYFGAWDKKLYAIGGPSTAKENELRAGETSTHKTENQTTTEKTFCGNNICEPPAESFETCWNDCCPLSGCEKSGEDFKKELGIWEKIVNFFTFLSPTKDMTIIYLLGAVTIMIVCGIVIALKKR